MEATTVGTGQSQLPDEECQSSTKIQFATETHGNRCHTSATSSPGGRGMSLPPLRPVVTIGGIFHDQGPGKDMLTMRAREETPPLSASDVLMTSFNVLEDGDPMHTYQVQGQQGLANQPQEHSSLPTRSLSWSGGGLEHNSTSILKALREPQARHIEDQSSWKNMTNESLYNMRHSQETMETVLTPSPGSVQQWSNQPNGPVFDNYSPSPPTPTGQDPTCNTIQTKAMSRHEFPSTPSTPDTSEGTLTRAVKETFFIAHFSCNHCTEKFRVPEKLAEHVKKVHSRSIVYTCFTCGKKFYNSFELREHVASHANDPIKCSLCDLTLASSKELRNHHKKVHPMLSLSCNLCDKIFVTVSARARHLHLDHQNDSRVIVCDMCGDTFVDKAAYEEHCKNHSAVSASNPSPPNDLRQSGDIHVPAAVVIWKCDVCGLIFPNDVELGDHKAVHRDEYQKPATTSDLIKNTLQERPKRSTSDPGPPSRYELLRLLLAKRMASTSKASSELRNRHGNLGQIPTTQDAPGISSAIDLVSANGDLERQDKNHQQGLSFASRGPDILSAEAMQHVADELSMFEQNLKSNRKGSDQLHLSKGLPMTADMIMDGESTIGINLALKKNTTQDMKVREIHKQKTLVNMLQGTVASIIEKEVKYANGANKRIDYDLPTQYSLQLQNKNRNVEKLPGVSPYETTNEYRKKDKPLENNNIVYHNRNLRVGNYNPSSQFDSPDRTIENPLPSTTQSIYSYLTSPVQSTDQAFPQMTLPSPQSMEQPGEFNQETLQGVQSKHNKSSAWDNHIAPLLKLFQNVSTPLEKAQEEGIFNRPSPKSFDGNSAPMDDILDLSNSHPHVYGVPPDNTSKQEERVAQQATYRAEYPRSLLLSQLSSSSQQTVTTSGDSEQPGNQYTEAQLPHFNDITWCTTNAEEGPSDLTSPILGAMSDSDYSQFPPISEPYSHMSQMSGGQLHYAESKVSEETYFGNTEPRNNFSGSQSSEQQQDHRHQYQQQQGLPEKEYGYQRFNAQHAQIPSPQEFTQLTQNTQQKLQPMHQAQHDQSFMPEGQSISGQSELPSPSQENPSRHQSGMNDHYQTDHIGNISMSPDSQSQTRQISPPSLDTCGQPANDLLPTFSSLLQQSPTSPAHQDVQHHFPQTSPDPQHQCINSLNSNPQYPDVEGNTMQDKLSKASRAICQYATGRNTFLAKRTIREVPLVIRHKLLATMLRKKAKAGEANQKKHNEVSPDQMNFPLGLPDSETGRLGPLSLQQGLTNIQALTPTGSSVSSENDEYSCAGLLTSTNQVLYDNSSHEAPCHDPMQSPNGTENQLTGAGHPHPNTSTIDSQLLNQMMYSQLPSPSVPLLPIPSAPVGETNYGRRRLSGTHPEEKTRTKAQELSQYKPYSPSSTNEAIQGSLKRNGKRKLMGPAIRRRTAVLVLQQAEDLYCMQDDAVNVIAPKKSRTCELLGCLTAKHVGEKPQRMRGRPPKNGSLSVRKGSYKKGKYPCPVCGKFYAWKNYLRIHIAKHDKVKTNP